MIHEEKKVGKIVEELTMFFFSIGGTKMKCQKKKKLLLLLLLLLVVILGTMYLSLPVEEERVTLTYIQH